MGLFRASGCCRIPFLSALASPSCSRHCKPTESIQLIECSVHLGPGRDIGVASSQLRLARQKFSFGNTIAVVVLGIYISNISLVLWRTFLFKDPCTWKKPGWSPIGKTDEVYYILGRHATVSMGLWAVNLTEHTHHNSRKLKLITFAFFGDEWNHNRIPQALFAG